MIATSYGMHYFIYILSAVKQIKSTHTKGNIWSKDYLVYERDQHVGTFHRKHAKGPPPKVQALILLGWMEAYGYLLVPGGINGSDTDGY